MPIRNDSNHVRPLGTVPRHHGDASSSYGRAQSSGRPDGGQDARDAWVGTQVQTHTASAGATSTWASRTLRTMLRKPPAWAQDLVQGLSSSEARVLVAAMDQDESPLHRDRLARACEMLVDRTMPLEQRIAIVDHLRRLPGWTYATFLAQVAQVVTPAMDGAMRCQIVERLAGIAPHRRASIMAAAQPLMAQNLLDRDRYMIFSHVAAMPDAQRDSVADSAAFLMTPGLSAEQRVAIIDGLALVRDADRPDVVTCVYRLSYGGVYSYADLIHHLGRTESAARSRLMELTQMLAASARDHEHAYAINLVLGMLANLSPADREVFGQHVDRAALTQLPSDVYLAAFSALTLVPAEERESVMQFAFALYTVDIAREFHHIILAVKSVPAAEREDFVAAILHARDGQALLASEQISRIEALAAAPAADRMAHARRLRRPAEQEAAEAFIAGVAAPEVDLENVMDSHRAAAAEAAAQRLRDRFPRGRDPSHDLRAAAHHLQALAPTIRITEAQKRAQWANFAQHMAAMPPSRHRLLQALATKMACVEARVSIPRAWTGLLQGFAKDPSFIQSDAYESMDAYFPPRDPVATTLASWLGHLSQFAYVPRGSSVVQNEQDEALETFVAYVRSFEIRTISALARVRGRTMATELTNALRTLTGASQGGDRSHAVRKEPSLRKLVGLVWRATVAAPEAERANMQHSFVMALAQCIEDDGHRVCPTGQTQRLVGVVEAQALTPSQKLTALSEAFAKAHAYPSAAQVKAFECDARQEATTLYGAGTNDMNDFEAQLRAYINFTF